MNPGNRALLQVTDAHVALGYINPTEIANGVVSIDAAAARTRW